MGVSIADLASDAGDLLQVGLDSKCLRVELAQQVVFHQYIQQIGFSANNRREDLADGAHDFDVCAVFVPAVGQFQTMTRAMPREILLFEEF